MSKGSRRRPRDPRFCSREQFEENWERVFPLTKHQAAIYDAIAAGRRAFVGRAKNMGMRTLLEHIQNHAEAFAKPFDGKAPE